MRERRPMTLVNVSNRPMLGMSMRRAYPRAEQIASEGTTRLTNRVLLRLKRQHETCKLQNPPKSRLWSTPRYGLEYKPYLARGQDILLPALEGRPIVSEMRSKRSPPGSTRSIHKNKLVRHFLAWVLNFMPAVPP